MANDLTGKVLLVDTAGTDLPDIRGIRKMAWLSIEGDVITAGDDLVVREATTDADATGSIVWRLRAEALKLNDFQLDFGSDDYKFNNGIHVEAIDNGILLIYPM